MKIAIITNSSSYEPKAHYVAEFLKSQGHQVTEVASDFIHREKIKGRPHTEGHIFIPTIPYFKNLSARRMYSHYNFSVKCYKLLSDMELDALYVLLPANSLAYFMAKYKKKYNVRLIFDVIDLWPESLPVKPLKNLWPLRWWRDLRNKSLPAADLIFTECMLYQTVLRSYTASAPMVNLYWTSHERSQLVPYKAREDYIHVCYLGSINHIIDLDLITELLERVNRLKPVWIHVVGDGEKRTEFLKKLEKAKLKFTYYGSIYEDKQKRKIFRFCHYGLNVMKESVCVGVTMKSIEYMRAGIPILNSIAGDTWDLIEERGIGYNYNKENLDKISLYMAENYENDQKKRSDINEIYQDLFSLEAFETVLKKWLLPVLDE